MSKISGIFKTVLFEHWEKLLLVFAVGFFVFNLRSVPKVDEDPQLQEAMLRWDELETNILGTQKAVLPVPRYDEKMAETWDTQVKLGSASEWVLDSKVKVSYNIQTTDVLAQGPVKTHVPPVLKLKAEPGFVRISWEADPANEASPTSFTVYKRTKPDEKLQLKIVSAVEESEVVDIDISPNTKYEYQVESTTSDPTIDPVVISNWASVITADNMTIEFTGSSGDPKTVSDPNYIVTITVTKFKGEETKSKEFPLKRNDKIGKSDVKEAVKDPVTNKITYVYFDFSTTFTVTDVYFDDKGKEVVVITDNTGKPQVRVKKEKSK